MYDHNLCAGSMILDEFASDLLFQHYRHVDRFVATVDRMRLINHTTVEPLIEPELASWLRAYILSAEAHVIAGHLTAYNARRNVEDALRLFGTEGFIQLCRDQGLSPVTHALPTLQGPCYPPPYSWYPSNTVSLRPNGATCHRCSSIWYCSGLGGACCNDCGATL